MASDVRFRRSAAKHGVPRTAVLHVLTVSAVYDEVLPGNVPVRLIMGDDETGRPLELLIEVDPDDGQLICFHAMPLLYRHNPEHPYRVLYNRGKELNP